jgi:hypothetical protein
VAEVAYAQARHRPRVDGTKERQRVGLPVHHRYRGRRSAGWEEPLEDVRAPLILSATGLERPEHRVSGGQADAVACYTVRFERWSRGNDAVGAGKALQLVVAGTSHDTQVGAGAHAATLAKPAAPRAQIARSGQ